MYTRLVMFLAAAAACGDNLIVPTDASDAASADAVADGAVDDAAPDSITPPLGCEGVAFQAGNPGPNASDYPADGWWSDDTRTNGTVVVDDSIPPPNGFGCASVKLSTGASTTSPSQDKAQLITFAKHGVALSTITTISYWAYRSSASTGGPAIDLSLNVSISGTGVPGNYATLVYEPYHQSGSNAAIVEDTWQQWNATATTAGDGVWWCSKIPNGTAGSQANPQTWAAFLALYPDAVIHGYGFNLGSVNPNMIVAGDGLVFGATTTDF
jgi:hypothetical protein